ncbi:MAG: hypothetical protein AAF950_01740 [Pseudomonadota bacterium]
MNQRFVPIAGIIALGISGCATVTEFRGEEVAIVSLTEEQSALRVATSDFGEAAEARGWITQSSGLLDLASLLVDGQAQTSGQSYSELIGVGMRPVDEVMRTIGADATDAAGHLSLISGMAQTMLLDDSESRVTRADLMAFEQVLVKARKCRNSFSRAELDVGAAMIPTAQSALDAFDAEIMRAHTLADLMVEAYTQIEASKVS